MSFGSHKSSPPPPQAPMPSEPPPSRVDPMVVQNEERIKQRRKRGRASTVLSGLNNMGDISAPATATVALLGKG